MNFSISKKDLVHLALLAVSNKAEPHKEFSLVPPTVREREKVLPSNIDRVERGGYVPNDKKIESFIESGTVLMNQRRGQGEYEIGESESDFEEDSPEYLEELEKEAIDYMEKNPPLNQFLDKVSANEILDEADKKMSDSDKASKRETKTRKEAKAESDAFSDNLAKKIAEAVTTKQKTSEKTETQ